MAEYALHCFYESGNAYKAALMLQLADADWEVKKVDFFNGETRGADWRSANNVMGEVPVLEHQRYLGNRTVTQSGAILTYLSRQSGNFSQFAPKGEEEELEALRWLLFDSQKVSGYAGPLRFLRTFAKTGETDVTKFLEGRLEGALNVLDTRLGDREWLAADNCTIADLACQGYLHWPDEIGVSFDGYPNLKAWLERIRALPRWKPPIDLMPRAFQG